MAFSGGAKYSPAMSRTFSTNSGSLDSLKVSWRRDCSPKARQMRDTAVCDKPASRAMARAPMHGSLGSALQGLGNHGSHARVVDRARRTAPRRIEQSVQSMFHEAGSPLRNGLRLHELAAGHHLVVSTFGTCQNNARAQRQRLRGIAPQSQGRELFMLGSIPVLPSVFHASPPRRVHSVHDCLRGCRRNDLCGESSCEDTGFCQPDPSERGPVRSIVVCYEAAR